MTTDQQKGLTINVSITDTEVFQGLVNVMGKIVNDDRVPNEIKEDVGKWLYDAGEDYEPYVPPTLILVLCKYVYEGKALWYNIKHKYDSKARVKFIGERSMPDGLRPDIVVLVRGHQYSAGHRIKWLDKDCNISKVVYE
ncbi:hypothetical protein ABIE27_004703 [Paenibacillus sp. 4624]|uniref:hypothetical protein n=1 Tax=Paenibacillus sp. 4624 TaxID=3156453 RepID=UPI003D23FB01